MRANGSKWVAALVVLTAACGGGGSGTASSTSQSSATASAGSTTTTTEAVAGFAASEITAGDQHACALDPDGAAYCWGYNRMGQLGDGTGTDSRAPVAVAGNLRFKALSAGRYFTCGLTSAGATWCWGDNSRAELGDGTTGKGGDTENRLAPVEVLGAIKFEELVTGQLHVCGRTATGETWCWGVYSSGELGNDASPDQPQPTRSAVGLVFDSLAAAGSSSCGLAAGGVTSCWGNNTFGQLGNGTKSNAPQPAPSQTVGPVRFTSVAMGRAHACGLDAEGAAWCWGGNTYGQLGDGTKDERLTPTAVLGDHRFSALTGGTTHTCGLARDGAAWCWGANSVGQLGDGAGNAAEDRLSPVAVAGGIAFTRLSAGEEFTCGLAKDGSAYCWGSNGVLGNGTRDASTEPVLVSAV